MTDTYTIYLVNESADAQSFWCFLAPPEALSNDPGVFANSSATINIAGGYTGNTEFIIPVQYIVEAGVSNEAVGLNIEILSNVTNDASLGDTWDAAYSNSPPNQGPTMSLAGTEPKSKDIAIVSNSFEKLKNERAGWYVNQTFGIQTEAGFIGMTWSPDPEQTRTLTPKLTFYISTGTYGSNKLANWDQVSNAAATINAPSNFDEVNVCTVTYTDGGNWQVVKGAPASVALSQNLSFFRSPEINELMAIAHIDAAGTVTDNLVNVKFDNLRGDSHSVGTGLLTGTVTVGTTLVSAFAYFFLSGVRFEIKGSTQGAKTFRFSYSGKKSADSLMKLFTSGATLIFGGAK